MKKRINAFVLILLLMPVISAAGVSKPEASPQAEEKPAAQKTTILTVSYVNEAAIDDKIAAFESLHPEIKVVATNHINDFSRYYEQLQKKLMTNEADDMFEVTGLPYFEYAEKGLLVDIYDYMEADDRFDPGGYFTNVFKAMEYKGGLYAFPKSFDLEFVTVNKNAPPELLDKFKLLDGIDYAGLVDLYKRYGSESGFLVEPEFTLRSKVYQSLPELVDFENKTCDFNNEKFIGLLIDYKAAAEPDMEERIPLTGGGLYRQSDEELSNKYMFRKVFFIEFLYFAGYENINFTNPIPLTSSEGEIIIDPFNAYAIYMGSQNQEAAWEFAKFLTSRSILSRYKNHCFSITKLSFDRLYWDMRDMVLYNEVHDVSGKYKLGGLFFDYVDAAFETVTLASNRPARMRFPYFEGSGLIFNEIDLYLRGLISAEQTAANIQSKMTIKLAE